MKIFLNRDEKTLMETWRSYCEDFIGDIEIYLET